MVVAFSDRSVKPARRSPGRRLIGVLALLLPLCAQAVSGAGAVEGELGPQAAWRVLSRLGYGPTAALLQSVEAAGGARPWALAQLDLAYEASQQPPVIPAAWSDFDAPLSVTFKAYRQEREARRALAPQPDASGMRETAPALFSRDVARHAAAWRLSQCSQSEVENPLLARMTEFWFNHLNVYAGKGAVRPYVGHYAVHAIRANALGRFEDLLLASARHPAMLFYLDQAQSVAPGTPGARGLNENYARELMELHTLGVHGGYTQADVRELARVLTGWTVDPNDDSGFRFAPRLHDGGDKLLLGHALRERGAEAGVRQGEAAVRMLARHPATAQRVALRLAQFFVADEPPDALVQRLASRFLASGGEIRVVLRSLIESPEFWQSRNRLFKTPMDYACSVLAVTRSAGGMRAEPEAREIALALAFLGNAGQPMHGWPTPDGYKTNAATWLAPEALTRRADFALQLMRNQGEPDYLKPFLSPATLQNIAKEQAALRAGLMLASPDFMSK